MEREEENKRGRKGRSRAIKGQLISCFSCWLVHAWNLSRVQEEETSSPTGFKLVSPCLPHTLTPSTPQAPRLHQHLFVFPLSIMRGPPCSFWGSEARRTPTFSANLQNDECMKTEWAVPVCLPPRITMRRVGWSVKGNIDLVSLRRLQPFNWFHVCNEWGLHSACTPYTRVPL
ncbi:hypothetical protein CgunFtcFv8_003459 [Champsocephalus gunnari]|uniref:Uncharacterized protein n=1 Tax=Champsocephalus gunnari TaxID=52237 RepID=A0AAN8DAX1_CHAGU|nr:hypothetical protein CgunFtcFv8_003459 [Champsocephalus gunnari]